jgi:hypothetical protein
LSLIDGGEQMPTKASNNDLLNVVNKHLVDAMEGCKVGKWLTTLSEDEQEAFRLVKEKNSLISLSGMYAELDAAKEIPFALTSFRLHFRGICSCPKKF